MGSGVGLKIIDPPCLRRRPSQPFVRPLDGLGFDARLLRHHTMAFKIKKM